MGVDFAAALRRARLRCRTPLGRFETTTWGLRRPGRGVFADACARGGGRRGRAARGEDAGWTETASRTRRGRAPTRRARRSRMERRYSGETLETGVTARRAHLYALGEAEPALEVGVRGVLLLGLLQPHAEALGQGRARGRAGTADGGRARRASGCRVSLCSGVHERVAAPRGAPYRRSRHRGGHRGVEWEDTDERDARDARGRQPRRVDARAVLSRHAPDPPVSGRYAKPQFARKLDKTARPGFEMRSGTRGRARSKVFLAQWLGIVPVPVRGAEREYAGAASSARH